MKNKLSAVLLVIALFFASLIITQGSQKTVFKGYSGYLSLEPLSPLARYFNPLPTLSKFEPLAPLGSYTIPTFSPSPTGSQLTPQPTYVLPTVTAVPTTTNTPAPTLTMAPTVTLTTAPLEPTLTPSPTQEGITQTPTQPVPTSTPEPILTPTEVPPTPTQSPQITVAPNSLVAYWRMEETSLNRAFDMSGNGFELVFKNSEGDVAPQWTSDVPDTTYENTGSVYLDGDTYAQLVNQNANTAFDFEQGFTLEAYFKPDDFSQSNDPDWGIVSKYGGSGYMIWINNPQYPSSYVDGNSLPGSTRLQADNWYHIAITWDGVNRYIYINGILENETPWTTPPQSAGQVFRVGTYALTERNALGHIDEVKVYNYARSQSQIISDGGLTALYLNELMPKPSEGDDWLELFNLSADPVDLSDWTLEDSTGIMKTIDQGTSIQGESYAVFEVGQRLNHASPDSISLKTSQGILIDNFSYASDMVMEDSSIGRNPDGIGNWKVCSQSSKDGPNDSC